MNPLTEILLRERTIRNISRKDLAKYLGIVENTYGKYERGEREPDINTLIKLADYYKVSLDYLCGRYNN